MAHTNEWFATQYDLTKEEVEALQADQIIQPVATGEKWKISAAFLSPAPSQISSTPSLSSTSGSSTASIRFRSLTKTEGTFDLPINTLSAAAIEWCGFDKESAVAIYSRWSQRPTPGPDSLLEYMNAEISGVGADMSANELLIQMHLNTATCDAIMDPSHTSVRNTETIKFWALDTININWLTLLKLKAKVKVAARHSHAEKKGKKAHVGTVFAQSSSQATQPSYTATVQSALEGLSGYIDFPKAHVVIVEKEPALLEDYYTLYKGKAAAEMDNWIREDGSIAITGLSTYPGGDFNMRNVAYYWTLERDTALQYQAYAARRCPYSETWMIRVQVKKTFIDSLRIREMRYSYDWKEFVWTCRKKGIAKAPEKFNELLSSTRVDLIKGHICHSDLGVLTKIPRAEVQARISEDNVMINPDGKKSSQWAFVQEDSVDRFADEIKGNIHIEVTPAANSVVAEASKS